MGTIRDSQRSRVYAAEGQCFADNEGEMSLARCQEFVDSVVTSSWWWHRSRIRSIQVTHGAKNGRAWAIGWDNSIRTSPGSRKKWVMLHELAHHMTQSGVAPHGPEFCANYVALTRQFLGRDQGDCLKAAFRNQRAKVRGEAKPTVIRIQCVECQKNASERGAWKVRMGTTYWFCTRRCGERWLSRSLEKVA